LDCSSRASGSSDQVKIDLGAVAAHGTITQESNKLPDRGSGLVLNQSDRRKALDLHWEAPDKLRFLLFILTQVPAILSSCFWLGGGNAGGARSKYPFARPQYWPYRPLTESSSFCESQPMFWSSTAGAPGRR
jgi:hypothetical protein